jgi:hypothetical protein
MEMSHRRSASVGNRSDAGSEAHRPRGFTREHCSQTVQPLRQLVYLRCATAPVAAADASADLPHACPTICSTICPTACLVQLEKRRRWTSACLAWWSARRPPCARLAQEWCRPSAPTARRRRLPALTQSLQRSSQVGLVGWLAGWVPAVIVWCPSACPSTAYASWGAARQSVLAGGSHPACGDVEVLNRPSRPCARPPAHCAERTSHLRPGTQFIKTFWMTEGVRTTNSSVVRCAGGGRQVAARSLHCDWRQCWVQYPCQPVDVPCPLWLAACRNAVHKVNKQPVSIKFYGCAAHAPCPAH